ncbi:hypothetical protein OG369_37425 [Streptomyces sp. NBC_01221]|uniref:hypothetical protein n=1 Tax=Streptomyces sp. NBC_01221 TaxID=2903782 RepID=UPI002250EC64|nr:hypothetical protein [Streptomyces sp. NBC_01221]MCX4791581.1 hypothetical protein [Streptomyces sp. NBC_01221]
MAGALEVEQQAVDDKIGAGRDAGADKRRATVAVLGLGAGAQGPAASVWIS